MTVPNLNFNLLFLASIRHGESDQRRRRKRQESDHFLASFKSPVSVSVLCRVTVLVSFHRLCLCRPGKSPVSSPAMNSSHGDLLADRLSRLGVSPNPADHHPVQAPDDTQPTASSHKPTYDGYGFRPPSGMSSPRAAPPDRTASPLPDVNGLGWPGQSIQSAPPPFLPHPPSPSPTSKVHPQSPQRIPRREGRPRN
jgi:hypothetical protein